MANGRRFDLRHHLPSATFVLILLLVLAGFAGIFIYTGVYNIGADAPHSRLVYMMMDEMRESAIAHHARTIVPPADLASAKRLAMGAGLYSEMCSGCHLGPGVERSELSQGLYPPAPELARRMTRSPAQQFWIIKHGIKLSAMPAWGKTHNDQLIWDIVAFLQRLPKLSPEQYEATVASAPEDHEEMMKDMGSATAAHASPQSAEKHAPAHEHSHSQGRLAGN